MSLRERLGNATEVARRKVGGLGSTSSSSSSGSSSSRSRLAREREQMARRKEAAMRRARELAGEERGGPESGDAREMFARAEDAATAGPPIDATLWPTSNESRMDSFAAMGPRRDEEPAEPLAGFDLGVGVGGSLDGRDDPDDRDRDRDDDEGDPLSFDDPFGLSGGGL